MKSNPKKIKVEMVDLGDSFLIPLPDEVLARLGVKAGDYLYMTETPTGILLTREPPDEED